MTRFNVWRAAALLWAALFVQLSTIVYASEQQDRPCILSMTYKDIGKPGYMDAAPSDEGLYKTMLVEAVEKIGCKLKIVRFPKRRTHQQLAIGNVDLYPSTGFEEERSDYLFFIPNGLSRHEPYLGLAPADVGELNSIKDINKYGLGWVGEAGSTIKFEAEAINVPYLGISDLTYSRAINMLVQGRRIFYRIIDGNYEQYLSEINEQDLTSLGISTHSHCCGTKYQDLYVGISRKSPVYAEEANPLWDEALPLSATNFPVRLVTGSIAQQLANALQEMLASGRTAELFNQYITRPGHTP
jgi:hypothetical protein